MRIFACGTDDKLMYALLTWTIRVTMLRFQYNKSHTLQQGNIHFLEIITFLLSASIFFLLNLQVQSPQLNEPVWNKKKIYIFKILHVYLVILMDYLR